MTHVGSRMRGIVCGIARTAGATGRARFRGYWIGMVTVAAGAPPWRAPAAPGKGPRFRWAGWRSPGKARPGLGSGHKRHGTFTATTVSVHLIDGPQERAKR